MLHARIQKRDFNDRMRKKIVVHLKKVLLHELDLKLCPF